MKRAERFLLLSVLLAVFPFELFAYNVYLKPKSIVSGDSVLLKDIARVEGSEDAGLKTVFASNDRVRTLSANDLRSALQKDPRLRGVYGSYTVILPLKDRISQESMQEILTDYIKSLQGGVEFLEDHTISVSGFESLQTGPGIELIPDIRSVKQLRPGRRILSLDIKDKNRILYRQKADLEIRLMTSVPVATRKLSSGERLKKSDFRMEKRPVFERPAPVQEGSLVMTDIASGKALKSPEVQNISDIRRGQTLELVYQKGSVVVKVRAIADESGNIGETIRVKLNRTGTGKSTVKNARVVSNEIAVIE